MEHLHAFLLPMLTIIIGLGLLLLMLLATTVLIIYIRDRFQSKHAILRNYPVLGHLRYFFEFMGHFFRQYFFAADREELPFNRVQRSWVYRAAKNVDTTVAFGSSHPLTQPGTFLFVNSPFPTLHKDRELARSMLIGPYCKFPYDAPSFFNISAMSYGSISKPAVLALSSGAKQANCWLNTGEGGISPHHLSAGCDLVAQIGTAKYGFRTIDGEFDPDKIIAAGKLDSIKMFEIKLSQGAKPGKGGILPAAKVTTEIAEIRGILPGTDSLSPNRFPEIENVTQVIEIVNMIRNLTGKPVGIKFVLGSIDWLEDLIIAIKSKGIEYAPDFFTLDSADGGTGAAPMPLLDYMGLPIRESLPLVVDLLAKHKLQQRIRLIASGKLITPDMVAWALSVGADFITTSRGFMFALGCIQALQCNKNNCPTGVTTHKKSLQKGLVPLEKAIRVKNYVKNMHKEVGQIAHSCGVSEPRKLQREHCRIIQSTTTSVPLSQLYQNY